MNTCVKGKKAKTQDNQKQTSCVWTLISLLPVIRCHSKEINAALL